MELHFVGYQKIHHRFKEELNYDIISVSVSRVFKVDVAY